MKPQRKLTSLIILKTEDEGKNWEPVMPDDIPDFIGTNEVITELVSGHFCKQDDGSNVWYRGEVVEEQLDFFGERQ